MSASNYIDYFRDIAVRHKEILHDVLSEGQDGIPGECRFSTFSMDDVSRNLRTQTADGIALHLHLYDWQVKDNEAGDVRGQHNGGFLITKKAQPNNNKDEQDVYVATELVVWDIVNKMYNEKNAGACNCYNFSDIINFNTITVKPVGPLWDNRYGWWVEFTYTKKRVMLDDLTYIYNPTLEEEEEEYNEDDIPTP